MNLACAIAVFLTAGTAMAANLYSSGAKTWNTSTANWGSTSGGPYTALTWNNANNDTAVFVGTAGTVTLGEAISVGGLLFNITGYTVSNSTYTLTFGAADNKITLNNVAAATISRSVGGSGNVLLTTTGSGASGTVTFNATSTGGWSGATTVNPNMTLSVDGANQMLLNTSAITINGGAISYGNILSSQNGLNFVNDSAPITFNGGGSFTWRPVNANTFNESIGSVTNNSGQVSVFTASQSGPGIATLTLSSLTRNDATSVLNFSIANGGSLSGLNSVNRIKVTGAGSTAGWATNTVGTTIIGPWATTGFSSADYAVYTNDYVAAGAGADTANDSNWTDAGKAYTLNTGSALTINTTRTITALRFYGAASTLTLGTGNLETFGLLFPGANAKIVASTGGALTTPAGGGNLFITTVAAAHTISAPINNNSGTVTLVKSGGNQLTLSSTASTYSGGTVINAGTLVYSADANLGASGSRNITFNGTATLSWGFDGSSLGTLTLNAGAAGNFSSLTNIAFTSTTGSGAVRAYGGQNKTVSLGDAITFTGDLVLAYNANNNSNLGTPHISFSKLNDAVGSAIQFYRIGGGTDSGQQGQIGLTGDVGALTFDNRQIQLLPKTGGSGQNMKDVVLVNNNGTPANKWVINTPLLNSYDRDPTFYLTGSNAGDNTFAGTIGDSTYGGPFSSGSGKLSLAKAGNGKWILPGTNTYSGTTTVSAGKLVGVVGGSCSNSAITVTAGTLGVLVTDTTQQWACAGLTHSAASTLEFAFGGNTPSTTLAPLQVNGDIVFVVAPTVSCTGSGLPAGTYPLVKWTGSFSGVAPSSLTLPTGTGLLVVDSANKTLWLSISDSGSSKQPLTWKGTGDKIWVANEAVYTKWQDATPVNTNYQEATVSGITVGDNVVFGTTGAGTVTLNTTVSPASMAVNSTANYIFSGTGSIAGPGGLTKANSGSLTLSTANSYSGGTLLSAGTLIVATNNALGTGSLVLGVATIQSSDANARTLDNAVVLNGNSIVGGTGSLTFNNSGTGTVIAASTITVNSSTVNATFGTSFNGAFGITKAGSGTMTLTGTNTYAGATTVSAGRLVVSGGQITNNAAVNVNAGNSTMIITNGANVFSGGTLIQIGNNNNNNLVQVVGSGVIGGPASLWDLGSAALNLGGSTGTSGSNNVLRVDGAGVAGGAVVTNVNQAFSTVPNGGTGHNTAPYCSIVLTNGGHFFNKGSLTIGNNYYNTSGRGGNDDSLIIVGGDANSMYYGSSSAVVVGDGIRGNTINNQIFVGAGGVLTNAGYNAGDRYVDFVVGHARDSQTPLNAIANNRVVVTDGGQVFPLGNITAGYNANSSVYGAISNAVLIANGGLIKAPGALNIGVSASGTGLVSYNGLTITTGGQLYSGADSTVGRASTGTQVNNNTAWVSGTNSLWSLGGKNLFVGVVAGTGVATGNVFNVTVGGMATNMNALIVSANNTLSLGAAGQIYANAVTNSGTMAVGLDKAVTPSSGRLSVNGNLNVSNARLDVSISGTPTEPCVIASYNSLTGAFAATNGLPATYKLEMNYKGLNQIAIVYSAVGTLIRIF
jgi:autotransporter-associated beta strand protein